MQGRIGSALFLDQPPKKKKRKSLALFVLWCGVQEINQKKVNCVLDLAATGKYRVTCNKDQLLSFNRGLEMPN